MRALALILVLLLAGCASAPAPPAGAPASWSFETIEGETITDDAPPRNATVLFFMATWCSSCRAKAPVLAEAHEAYAERGVATYSLDFDPSETPEDLRAWQARYGQTWPHALDRDRALQRLFDVRSQSTVVVLDGGGSLVRHFGYGQVDAAGLRAALDEALDSKAPSNVA